LPKNKQIKISSPIVEEIFELFFTGQILPGCRVLGCGNGGKTFI